MKKILLWSAIILGSALVIYNIWAYAYRAREKKSGWVNFPRSGKMRFREYTLGKNNGNGNLIAIQPYVTPQNYSTGFNFLVTLRLYMEQIKKDSLIKKNTVVVFPEHIGTPLFACNEKENIYTRSTIKSAMNTMVLSNFFTWAPLYLSTDSVNDKKIHSILSMKSVRMADLYNQCFSSLAKEFNVTIIAGSIVLPQPYINDSGQLKSGKGSLYNTFVTYGPDGKALPELSMDIFSPQGRNTSTKSDNIKNLPFFKTPAGGVSLIRYHRASLFTDKTPDTVRSSASMSFPIVKSICLEFTGDMWDRSFDGIFIEMVGDSVVSLGPASKRGRIINSWMR
jgi:hypothetical protein